MKFKTIGILGGMGPATSAYFYSKIISLCQEKFAAAQDTDYPPVILNSLPLEGFNESGIINPQLVKKQLTQGVKTLEKSGCDFIVIPCNTVHLFIEEMRKVVNIPILSIIDVTVNKIKQDNLSKIGLLASETLLKTHLYSYALLDAGIKVKLPLPDDCQYITALILETMAGKISASTKDTVLALMEKMYAPAFLLGCTELPLALSAKDFPLPLYSSLDILAEVTLNYAVQEEKIHWSLVNHG